MRTPRRPPPSPAPNYRADRILFGSDADPAQGVDAILEADFLTEEQKRAILRDNAARFLRLDEDTCR